MAINNMFSAADDDVEGIGTTFDREFEKAYKILKQMHVETKGMKEDAEGAAGAYAGKQVGGGKLGLGTMPIRSMLGSLSTGQKVAGGMAIAGSLGMSMAPNTMSAVAQRMYADSIAGLSGMKASQVIGQSNRLVQGATSAGGPTQAAANLFYQGGYSASSLSSKNIMSSLGGLSAMTGGTNEQVASSLANINGMGFLRGGVRIRDNNGNLLPINQIVNSVYTVLYGGRKVTEQQAAMLLNPNSKGYQTLLMLTGGDTALMNTIAMAVITRARKGSNLSKKDLQSSNQALNIMGVEGNSPIRSNFNFAKGENMSLAATQAGLVNGYNVSLNTVGGLNRAFADLASTLSPVTYGLMSLKGALQTFPQAGNMGGTVSGLASMASGVGGAILQTALMGKVLGIGRFGTSGAAALQGAAATGVAANAAKGAEKFKLGKAGKLGGAALVGMIAQALINSIPGIKNHKDNKVVKYGNIAATMGIDAATGAAIGSFLPGPGTAVGAVLGTLYGAFQGLTGGGGGSDGSGGNNNTGGSGSSSGMGLAMPVPNGTPISSPFGNRRGGHGVKPGFHSGIDYKTPVGTPVQAMADGVVTKVGNEKAGWGNYVLINHGKVSSRYAHLSQISVKEGQSVKRGQVIGKSGGIKGAAGSGNSTGPHLHTEVLQGGKAVNPQSFFGKAGNFLSNLFKDGINMAKNVVGYLTGGNTHNAVTNPFRNSQSPEARTPGNLSSASLTSILNGDLNRGKPVGYSDIDNWFSNKKRSMYLNHNQDALINNSYNQGRGEGAGRMAGGSRKGMMDILRRAGFSGKALDTAFAVALAESGGRMDRPGDVNLQTKKWGPSIGMFQIRSLKHWQDYNSPQRDAKRLTDADFNAQSAFKISKGGTNWKPWSTYTSGAFLKYIDDAHRVQGGQGSGSGMPMELNTNNSSSKHHIAQVKVEMKVHIERSSIAEAEQMFQHFAKRLETGLAKSVVMTY